MEQPLMGQRRPAPPPHAPEIEGRFEDGLALAKCLLSELPATEWCLPCSEFHGYWTNRLFPDRPPLWTRPDGSVSRGPRVVGADFDPFNI
jgi:hypothetical protein